MLRVFLNARWDKAGFRERKLPLADSPSADIGHDSNRRTVMAIQQFTNAIFSRQNPNGMGVINFSSTQMRPEEIPDSAREHLSSYEKSKLLWVSK